MVGKVLGLATERKEEIVGIGEFVERKVLVLILGGIVESEGKTVLAPILEETEEFGGIKVPVQILVEIEVLEGTTVFGQTVEENQVFELFYGTKYS